MQVEIEGLCPAFSHSSSYKSDSDVAMLTYKWKLLSKQAHISKKEYEKALLAKLDRSLSSRYEGNMLTATVTRNHVNVYGQTGEFCLGASRGGYAVDGGVSSWLSVLDRARYGIIRSSLLQLANWSQAWTLDAV
ncbi:hypothetical protein BDV34DRAFT_224090 [Aspergillus parasiticus]|uniref:Uncharacterized protein n=1 Tax=Aspergillus parasiticus TaxID=5067 RepID=A0A5N6DP44_ASPPA|nr:hypothetical protein BDV34DRAFT_224090 [Aspergillus parasiticus]